MRQARKIVAVDNDGSVCGSPQMHAERRMPPANMRPTEKES